MLLLNIIDTSKELILDSYMVQVVTWLLVFLFSSLIAIIVWLAKGVLNKLETVSDKQDRNQNQMASVENKLNSVRDDMAEIKNDNADIKIRLNSAETKIALHAQWIRIKGGDIRETS